MQFLCLNNEWRNHFNGDKSSFGLSQTVYIVTQCKQYTIIFSLYYMYLTNVYEIKHCALHENANLRFFTNICKCKQLPLVIFAGNLWTPEHEWNYRMPLSFRNATPKDLQMHGIYFHIFEQIMSSSEIYHIFDVSLSTYFFLETYKFNHLFSIMHKDSLLPRFTMKNGFWKTL